MAEGQAKFANKVLTYYQQRVYEVLDETELDIKQLIFYCNNTI